MSRWLPVLLLAFLAAGPSPAVQPVAEATSTPSLTVEAARTPRQLLDGPVFQALPDPRGNGRIYAVTLDGLMRSRDGGTTWESIGTGLPINENSARYTELEIDPAQPDVLYDTFRVYRSTDDGETWQRAAAGLPSATSVAAVARGTGGGSVLFAIASGAHPGVYRSSDRAASWSQVGEIGPIPAGDSFDTRAVAVPEDLSSTLYVYGTLTIPHSGPCGGGCSESHLYRSLDGGATWTTLDPVPFPPPSALEVDAHDPDVLFATAGGTFYRSTDRGESWEVASERAAMDLVADPRREGGVYRVTFSEGVYYSPDRGTSWQRVAPGFAPFGLDRLAYLAAPTGSIGPDVLFISGHEGLWALDLAPPVPQGPSFVSPEIPGFRVWVRISSAGGSVSRVRAERDCLPETLCVSGAVPGRSELFVRIVGPKPNGKLWPTLVKFTTSRVEVWIEQVASGQVEYYVLPAARPGVDELNGLFDRQGFTP